MISYVDELEALFDLYEDEHLSENEIFVRCVDLVKKHNLDRDFMFDLNDTIFNRGYSFQFKVPKIIKEDFNADTYESYITNAAKSEIKTIDLISYLNRVKNHILTLCSLYAIKTKFLIKMGILSKDDDFITNNANLSFRDLLFKSFDDELDVKEKLIQSLEQLGMEYPTLEYSRFRLDCEYLLWSIDKKDPNNGYIKQNTLKVACNIAPKEFFARSGKLFYNPKLSLVTKKYLKNIDKKAILKIKNKWGDRAYITDNSGYALFYDLLNKNT